MNTELVLVWGVRPGFDFGQEDIYSAVSLTDPSALERGDLAEWLWPLQVKSGRVQLIAASAAALEDLEVLSAAAFMTAYDAPHPPEPGELLKNLAPRRS